jgi:hypothetical protein
LGGPPIATLYGQMGRTRAGAMNAGHKVDALFASMGSAAFRSSAIITSAPPADMQALRLYLGSASNLSAHEIKLLKAIGMNWPPTNKTFELRFLKDVPEDVFLHVLSILKSGGNNPSIIQIPSKGIRVLGSNSEKDIDGALFASPKGVQRVERRGHTIVSVKTVSI